jgi:hypothetical protein
VKKTKTIRFIFILLGASLLAACGQATAPNANPSTSTVSVPASAPTLASSNGSATAPTVTPIQTANSKSSAVSSTASNPDACTLLTKDDVSKVFGQAVGEGVGKGLGGVCAYTAKDLTFEVTVIHTGGAKYIKDTRTKLGALALDLPGVGDGSFYNTNSFINTLFLGKGDAVYLIDVKNVPSNHEITPEDVRTKEKALAQQLLSRLK